MTTLEKHRTRGELEAGLDEIRRSPRDEGILEIIVRRPRVGEREMVDEAALDAEAGLVGDSWSTRRDPDPDAQLTLMNARLIALVAGPRDRWPLAGDQLFVDLDLGVANLPPGTRLALGSAVIEITPEPHTGCRKFVSRYGLDAQKFVNSPVGRELRLRGVNARVVRGGTIRRGDTVGKVGQTGG
jgi:MOSC domain-containing protein YiiM